MSDIIIYLKNVKRTDLFMGGIADKTTLFYKPEQGEETLILAIESHTLNRILLERYN